MPKALSTTHLKSLKLKLNFLYLGVKSLDLFLIVRSVQNRTSDLFDYTCDCKADLAAITETWLTTDDAAVRAELCYCDSLSVRGIEAGEKESFEYSEWTISSPSLNLRLVLLYRPPYAAELSSLPLETILLSKEHPVIAGDFNIHVDVPQNPDSVKLLDLLQSVGLQQHITEPTQIQGHTLDLVITPSSDDILNKVPLVDRFISDHASVCRTLLPDRPYVTTKKVAYRKLKSVDLESLSRDLSDSLSYSDPRKLQVDLHSGDP